MSVPHPRALGPGAPLWLLQRTQRTPRLHGRAHRRRMARVDGPIPAAVAHAGAVGRDRAVPALKQARAAHLKSTTNEERRRTSNVKGVHRGLGSMWRSGMCGSRVVGCSAVGFVRGEASLGSSRGVPHPLAGDLGREAAADVCRRHAVLREAVGVDARRVVEGLRRDEVERTARNHARASTIHTPGERGQSHQVRGGREKEGIGRNCACHVHAATAACWAIRSGRTC